MDKLYKIKVAVVGCGYWGKNLVRVFSELNALIAICDENIQNAKKLSATYQVPVLSFDEILLDKNIQAVVIAVPAEQHARLTEKALKAGKHVFVEKPLALHVGQGSQLCALARQSNKILMVGHLLQYHPAFRALHQLVWEGQLGKLQYIYSNRLNLGKVRHEENIIWSFAPHDISMILSLVGELPESVYVKGSYHLNPNIADISNSSLTFKSGINAHIFVSWLHPYKEQKLIVIGDKGMAVFDDGQSWPEKLQLYPHQIQWVNGMPTPAKAEMLRIKIEEEEPLVLECQHFLDCVQSGIQPRTNGEEGLNVLRVLDAAEHSLRTFYPVSLEQRSHDYFKHETAYVDKGCLVGKGTKVWHFSHILEGSKIGRQVIIGQNVMIGPDVHIGDFCKIQNNVSLYKGVTLEEGVFCGPSCVFTNVNNPRAEIERKDEFRQTYVERGATIGANATIVCGVRLGAYCFIGAGTVVTKNVPRHALMIGTPARQTGWVSHAGERLNEDFLCPREKRRYRLNAVNDLEEVIREKRTENETISA